MSDLLHALRTSEVIELGHPMFQGMPQSVNHPPFRMALERRHGDFVRPDGGSASSELIVTGGHVGTHVDALCHVSQNGALADATPVSESLSGGRFGTLGIETVPPLIARGLLLDVASHFGTDCLGGGYEITVADLKRTAHAQGTPVGENDVVLIRTGWASLWPDPERFRGKESGVPGIGTDAAEWLAEQAAVAVGSDTLAFEVIRPGRGHAELPVHRIMLVERKIHIIETLDLEQLAESGHRIFGFVALPLRIVGATGSPIRPIALCS